jgi:predicted permease
MLSDIRFACRALARSRAFTLTAIGALGLAIGANTAIFSIVNQVLLNPSGVADPGRVVALRVKYDKLAMRSIPVSVPDFADVERSTAVVECAALRGNANFNYTGSGAPERLRGAPVSYRWFDVFRARPLLGRTFAPEEDRPGANHVTVLSNAAWKRLFGGDEKAIGRTMELNGQPYRVVGVMGREFRWPSRVDLWVPLGLAPAEYARDNRFNEGSEAFVRLKRGVSFGQANALVQVVSDRLRRGGGEEGKFATDAGWGMFLVPFTDYVAGDTKRPMLVLLGAVGFVLLIACSNIAGLMLARASGRARDIAVRAALGAGRWDLIRQALTESVVIAIAGAVLGLGLAYAGVRALLALAPEDAVATLRVHMDATVLLFTAAAGIAAGILSGIAPAWQTSRFDLHEMLKEGGRSGGAGRARQRLRSSLVTGEIALALVLLVGAGLLLRSLTRLAAVSPGFDPSGVITASVSLPDARYHEDARKAAFFQAVLDRLSSLPGVTAVAAGAPVPFSGEDPSASFEIEGRPSPPGDPGPHGNVGEVTPGYFAALKIPLRGGETFTGRELREAPPAVVIDDTLARQYWPHENPIGRRLRMGREDPWGTIIGVVGHVKNTDLAGDLGKGRYYYSLLQRPLPFSTLVVRTKADPDGLANSIREAVLAVDPAQPVSQVKTLSDMVVDSLAARRFVVTVLAFFAAVALLMAGLGLYGVIGYSVAQRTQEIGVRMAVGAAGGDILRLVIAQGMRLAVAGAAIGLAASLALSRVLESQLFQVSAFDPLTLALMLAVLIGAALLGSYIPARRATRVDPLVAMRYE